LTIISLYNLGTGISAVAADIFFDTRSDVIEDCYISLSKKERYLESDDTDWVKIITYHRPATGDTFVVMK
jgi:hypothetical protein